jgi:sugar lactone lactonase YvrE
MPQPLVAAGHCELGEGPVWDHRRQRFYWVDITSGHLHWLDHHSTQRETISLGQPIGFAALTDDPDVLAVGRSADVAWLNVASGKTTPFLSLEAANTSLRCNDGKCDPGGRLWVGTMPMSDSAPKGSLYSLVGDGSVQRTLTDLGCSNGLAWDTKNQVFYFIDSSTRRIDQYQWNPKTGAITDGKPLVAFDDPKAMPDGMCIDAEGHLWVGFWDGGCLRRIDGQTGAILQQIDLPVARVTSCTFGGEDCSTLFITTAAEGLSPQERAEQPLAGSIFTLRPGPRGQPAHLFHYDRLVPA